MRSKKYKYTKQEADALIQALEGVSVCGCRTSE